MAAPAVAPRAAEVLGPTRSDGVIMIRPMTPGDVEAHVAGHDAKRARYLGAFPSTPEKVLEWIESNRRSWANGGPIYNFGVVEVATNQLVGMVEANTSAHDMEGVAEGEANISYNIYPHAREQGYAARAVSLVVAFLDGSPLSAAVIRAEPENAPSLGVAKSCGFLRTGQIVSQEVHGWTMLDVYHHTLR
jgi:RimJ/RimL family protein N-acetyltransferase